MVTIGVTSQVPEGAAVSPNVASYLEGVRHSGAAVRLLPWTPEAAEDLLASIDGVLLTGGPDLDPAWYGQTPHATVARNVAPHERDAIELALARLAFERGVPVLGICRGLQVMNVALGGTLIQDIPSALPSAGEHQQQDPQPGRTARPRGERTHRVTIEPDSLLARVLRSEDAPLIVNSMHHQAAGRIAPALRVVARAAEADSSLEIAEGLEAARERHPFYLAVQWHPEELANPRVGGEEHAPDARRLFDALAQAAQRYAAAEQRGALRP